MKIISFRSLAETDNAYFLPDTAMLRHGAPLFHPEGSDPWELQPHLAIHINRLGKGIPEKFASRYFNAVSLALLVRPTGSDYATTSLMAGMDDSIITSASIDSSSLPDRLETTLEQTGLNISLKVDPELIARAIHIAAAHITLKMGDIILLPPLADDIAPSIPLSPRSRITLTGLLDLKVV
ncbi:MAG: hypothetical protein J1E29_03675 [Duncaniella sp.]|nr:hypothetical protein [Duncaniella sp.]